MVQNVHFFIELRDFFVFLRPQTKYYPQNEHFNGANIDHDSFLRHILIMNSLMERKSNFSKKSTLFY